MHSGQPASCANHRCNGNGPAVGGDRRDDGKFQGNGKVDKRDQVPQKYVKRIDNIRKAAYENVLEHWRWVASYHLEHGNLDRVEFSWHQAEQFALRVGIPVSAVHQMQQHEYARSAGLFINNLGPHPEGSTPNGNYLTTDGRSAAKTPQGSKHADRAIPIKHPDSFAILPKSLTRLLGRVFREKSRSTIVKPKNRGPGGKEKATVLRTRQTSR